MLTQGASGFQLEGAPGPLLTARPVYGCVGV